jgi:cation transporter-like permease
MKSNLSNNHNLLFNLACRGLKYLLLALLGFALAYLISKIFGFVAIVKILQSSSICTWLLRVLVFIFCLFALAMISESSR